MFELNFVPSSIEVKERSNHIPAGTYLAMIEEIKLGEDGKLKPTSNGKGQGFTVVYKLLDEGAYEGWRVSEWFNIQHENPVAESISKEKFALLASSIDMAHEKKIASYVNKVLRVQLGVTERGNDVKKYFHQKDAKVGSTAIKQQLAPTHDYPELNDQIPF